MKMTQLTLGCAMHLGLTLGLPAAEPDLPKPPSHTERVIEGWTVRLDNRLLQAPHVELGVSVLKSLESRLFNINAVVRPHVLSKLHGIRIVLDMSHGALRPMQYHPDAGWLKANGYAEDLAQCVHIPVAAALIEPRQIHTQPWCVLHELAHAYHDQVLGFDEVRIRDAYAAYKASGRGEAALLVNGERARHYGLTNHKEFFAEMTEAYFGTNDFFPFNRGELKTAEPEIYELMKTLWGPVQNGEMPESSMRMHASPGIPSGSVRTDNCRRVMAHLTV